MLNKVSEIYALEILKKVERLMWNNRGKDRFVILERIYKAMKKVCNNEFINSECCYIYETIVDSYELRDDAIYAYVTFCLSFIPSNRSRCLKMMELGVEQLMIGAVDR